MEIKAFLPKLKHQYRVSQRGEHDFNAQSLKYGDYYENPHLPHLLGIL